MYYVVHSDAAACRPNDHYTGYTPATNNHIQRLLLLHGTSTIGYEPADLTVHPPPQNYRGWVHFFRIGV